MKRIVALAMMIALLAIGAQMAVAEEWNSAQPYAGVPEIDLTTQLGYMVFYPNDVVTVEGVCDQLFIYLPRTDVTAGEGQLFVFTEEDGEVWRARMNDADCVQVRPLNDGELEGLLWSEGTCFEIRLPRSLTLGKMYYVNLERGCIAADGVENVQIGGTEAWFFEVQGEFGLNAVEYRRPQADGGYEEMISKPQAGDEIHFELVLGGEAVAAALYSNDETLDFEVNYFTESGEVTGTVTGGAPAWGVVFLDAEGNIVGQADF